MQPLLLYVSELIDDNDELTLWFSYIVLFLLIIIVVDGFYTFLIVSQSVAQKFIFLILFFVLVCFIVFVFFLVVTDWQI